jgi:purine-binding chemotaxis protein CheW
MQQTMTDIGTDTGPRTASQQMELVAFSVGEQTYGLDIMAIQEIRTWSGETPLPNRAEYMRGIINFRGAVVPIFDLRLRFGMTGVTTTKANAVIVTSVDGELFGLLVDTVSDIISIARTDVQPVPETGLAGDDFLSGLVTKDDKTLGVLDLGAVLARNSRLTQLDA